jgi:hypothetical protein
VSNNFIFISCGQYSKAEKSLGRQIAAMVKKNTGLESFFAEDVQDLTGLDDNILKALRDCAGFITVLHPRGTITRPGTSDITRASVWIEQEIAVATYIKRVEKRQLPIIAFKHSSVGREGIRELLQLNPIEFSDESEVLAALPNLLKSWTPEPSRVELQLCSERMSQHQGHPIRSLQVRFINNTNNRFSEYVLKVWIPAAILSHWPNAHVNSILEADGRCCFMFDQSSTRPINPCDSKVLMTSNYCQVCALPAYENMQPAMRGAKITAKIWIDGTQYTAEKTIKELGEDDSMAAH